MSVLVLFSGGVDSTLLAQQALKEKKLSLLMFARYGQPAAAQEARAVYDWRLRNGQPELWEPILPIGALEMDIGSGVAGSRVVPGRNLILLAHAISRASSDGIKHVWYGAHQGDYTDYEDCRPEFVRSVSALAASWGVTVHAPLMYWTKKKIMERALLLGIDVDKTWSCYQPILGEPCGTCNACRSRKGE